MLIHPLALVSEHPELSIAELARASAAFQKQAIRDVAPTWEVRASIDVFPNLDSVPVGYWPVVITDRNFGDSGVHLDDDGHPYALVHYSPDWTLTASHECVELCVDPSGMRTIPTSSPDPANPSERVEVLLEVCDPVQHAQFAYTIDGITVCDFYTPAYLGPVGGAGRLSFNASPSRPREVLPGGYITWRDPTSGEWFQLSNFDGNPTVRNLGALPLAGRSAREAVNAATPTHLERLYEGFAPELREHRRARRDSARAASMGRARRLRDRIARSTRRDDNSSFSEGNLK
jgi:hypothetical protein